MNRVSMIDLQANLMQKAFAAGRMDDARAHCKIFTELARKRAKSFLNAGTGCAAGLVEPTTQARQHPIHGGLKGGDMGFKEQYKHPKWQKRRLEVLEKSGFTCTCCGSDETQLHVHHRQYFKGRMIWEYADDELEVLCETCHQDAHQVTDALKTLLSTLPVDGMREVAALIAGYRANVAGPAVSDGCGPIYNDLYMSEPHAFLAGNLAAAATQIGMFELEELTSQTQIASHGGRIDVLVPPINVAFGTKPAGGGFA